MWLTPHPASASGDQHPSGIRGEMTMQEPLWRSDADWFAGARARHEVGLFEAREPAFERVGE
jgi:hypothetical protein